MRPRTVVSVAVIALTLVAHALSAQEPDEAKSMRVYMMGNSLTDNTKYDGIQELAESRGYSHLWARQSIPGAPIFWLWDHPDDGFRKRPYGTYPTALGEYEWDALTLQPFNAYNLEIDAAHKLMDLALEKSPNIQLCIYAQWPTRGGEFARRWLAQPEEGQKPAWGTKAMFEMFTRHMRRDYSDAKPVRLIPAGHAMYLLDQRIKAGMLPGFDKSVFEFYADGVHLKGPGAYVAGTAFFSVLYGESPIGLSVPEKHYGEMDPEVARQIQLAVWQVVANNPLTGVVSDDPISIVSPFIAQGVSGEGYRFPVEQAFGKGALKWSVGGGQLPEGLVLADDGVLSGRITGEPGTYSVAFKVTDSKGRSAEREYEFPVVADSAPEITLAEMSDGRQGDFYELQMPAQGGNGEVRWDIIRGQLPVGMHLSETGLLSGSPGKAGDFELFFEARDADPVEPDRVRKKFTWHIEPMAPDTLMVRKVAMAVELDGKLDEPFWAPGNAVSKPVGGRTDNKATFDLVWNELNHSGALALGVRVLDEDVVQDSVEPDQDDSVELFIDWLNNREGVYNFDDRRIVIDTANRVASTGSRDGVRHAVHRTEDGYTVEILIDIRRNFRGFSATPFMPLGVDVAVNDDDDGGQRNGRLVWRGKADNETVPDEFGGVLLGHYGTIHVDAPLGERTTLVAWEFGDEMESAMKAALCAAQVDASELTLGPGQTISGNGYYNAGALCPQPTRTDDRDEDNYIAWTVAPKDGYRLSIEALKIGLWRTSSEALEYELRWSTDGFKTSQLVPWPDKREIPKTNLFVGLGTLTSVDLPPAALKRIAGPVEFRLYLWGASICGIGKVGKDRSGAGEDLAVIGTLDEAN